MQNGPYNCNITQFAPCTETDFSTQSYNPMFSAQGKPCN